ncbi:hypothetical protein BDQ17DRAFT_1242485 [Cyathus striatus]|nr:hypothetical protein BDQ17DRAFT_1242485 [Cyathus striatus]
MAAPSYPTTKVAHPSTTSCHSKYHPTFSYPDADVVLRSLEGTLYRVHSFTLCNTSGLFSTMFCLPQPKRRKDASKPGERSCPPDADIIDVYEADFELERLLCLLCGIPAPRWESFSDMERVLVVAEKWDTPGPIGIIRSCITAPRFLKADPLRLYQLATHFGWKEEAKLASTHTLTLDLHDPAHSHIIEQLSSKDLLPLLNLHRKRRDQFRHLLDSPERFTAGNSSPYHCSRCGVTQLDNHTWRELKSRMFIEVDRRPLGDTLAVITGGFAEWPEALACWQARCSKVGCGGLNYDRVSTLRQIKNCIDSLPTVIEDCLR